MVRAATDAQRRRLLALRDDGSIGDAAFQRVEEELDWADSIGRNCSGRGSRMTGGIAGERAGVVLLDSFVHGAAR